MDKVEQVARAIHESRESNVTKHWRCSWDELTISAKASMLARARAAIEAMKGPTPEMLVQGEGVSDFMLYAEANTPECRRMELSGAYDAMLEAALNSKGEG